MSLEGGPRPERKEESETIISLPNKEEMLQRLTALDADPHLQQKLYPLLLKNAGREKYPLGVVILLNLALNDYTENNPPEVAATVSLRAPQFIDALVPDSKKADEVKQLWRQMDQG